MKILVTGATGQLGHDVCGILSARGIPYIGLGSADCDICDRTAVSTVLERERPDAVIHCAAYTAVDRAEDEREKCLAVNGGGTRNVAAACSATGAKMLYLSTDYVFPGTGDRPWEPEDAAAPVNVYGESKLAGERAVQELLDRYFIVRISWVFGVNGRNFIKTMLRLAQTHDEIGVVCDQIGSPTYTADLAPLLCDMIMTEKYGVYHAANEGLCSWAELAEEVFALAGTGTRVRRLSTAEYPTRAARPLNSRMSKNKLSEAGFSRLPEWRGAVRRYIDELHGTEIKR